VQVHFQDIFQTLFEGGDAELRMVGEDPLECEIEIAARPRGKHLQSISLMSGGERALTAIALSAGVVLAARPATAPPAAATPGLTRAVAVGRGSVTFLSRPSRGAGPPG